MTKAKFYINMIIIFILTMLAIVVSGNSLVIYIDIASLVLGILLPYIIISMIYSPKEQLSFNRAILGDSTPIEKEIIEKSLLYFSSFKKLLTYSAFAWTIMGAIAIGVHLEGPEALGLNFGVLMIIPLYVSLFLLLVIEPLRASAEKKLKS